MTPETISGFTIPEYSTSGPMELITHVPSISPNFLCGKLKQYFEEHDTETVAVTLENKPVGFLSYKNIAHHFLTQFGYALFQFRPVQEMMSVDFLKIARIIRIYDHQGR